MPTYDAQNAQCLVFTFKEGMLSALAHDLKIQVTHMTIDVDEKARTIDARFDAKSLRVVTVMKKGVEAPGELGPDHFKKIEGQIVEDVLESNRYPEIRFRSTSVVERDGGFQVEGLLTLHGVEKPRQVVVRRTDSVYLAECELDQTEFGITPFS